MNTRTRHAAWQRPVPAGSALRSQAVQASEQRVDRKQMVVVTDHDSKVLARRTFRCKAWDLGSALRLGR